MRRIVGLKSHCHSQTAAVLRGRRTLPYGLQKVSAKPNIYIVKNGTVTHKVARARSLQRLELVVNLKTGIKNGVLQCLKCEHQYLRKSEDRVNFYLCFRKVSEM